MIPVEKQLVLVERELCQCTLSCEYTSVGRKIRQPPKEGFRSIKREEVKAPAQGPASFASRPL
jgi:hypothetical protein